MYNKIDQDLDLDQDLKKKLEKYMFKKKINKINKIQIKTNTRKSTIK